MALYIDRHAPVLNRQEALEAARERVDHGPYCREPFQDEDLTVRYVYADEGTRGVWVALSGAPNSHMIHEDVLGFVAD